MAISTRATGRTPLVPQLNNTLPTRGILANHLICRHCGYKYPLHLDVFDSITLSLPANPFGSSIVLERCLEKFVSSELIDDFMCEACSTRSSFDKKIEFIKLPKLLCFHLQRLVWMPGGGQMLKRPDHVKFPEYLEMDPFTYQYQARGDDGLSSSSSSSSFDTQQACLVGGKMAANDIDTIKLQGDDPSGGGEETLPSSKPKLVRYKYALSSVIVHLGNSSSGHFICYRRRPTPHHHRDQPCNRSSSSRSKWYCASDLSVHETSASKVFASSAYMLFYERVFDLVVLWDIVLKSLHAVQTKWNIAYCTNRSNKL